MRIPIDPPRSQQVNLPSVDSPLKRSPAIRNATALTEEPLASSIAGLEAPIRRFVARADHTAATTAHFRGAGR